MACFISKDPVSKPRWWTLSQSSIISPELWAQLRWVHVHMSIFIAGNVGSDNICQAIDTVPEYELQQVSGEPHRADQASSRLVLSDEASCCQHSECWVCRITLTSSRHPQTPRRKELQVVSCAPCCLSVHCDWRSRLKDRQKGWHRRYTDNIF